MKLWLIRIGIAFVFNAITLWAASILPGVRVGQGFWWAVLVFTAATVLVRRLVGKILGRPGSNQPSRAAAFGSRAVEAGAGLISTLVILLATSMFSDGFRISGPVGWIIVTVVIWAASLVYDFVDDGLEAKAAQLLGGPAERRRGN